MLPDFKSVAKIRMGPGVIGRTSFVAMMFTVALIVAIVAVRNNPWMVFVLVVIGLGFALFFMHKAFSFAEKHPQQAVLDGGELVRYFELEQAASDPNVIDTTAVPTANTSPPPAISDSSTSAGEE